MKSCPVNRPRLALPDVSVFGTIGATPLPSHQRIWSQLKWPRSARAVMCSQPVACLALNAMGTSWAPGGLGHDTVEPQCHQIQFVDERFNNPDRVVLRHVVIQAVREQRSLPPVLAFHK